MGDRRIKIYQIPWIIGVIKLIALFLMMAYWINSSIQFILLQVYISTTWLHMGLRLCKQATKLRRVHPFRPPPKPDPKASKRQQRRNHQLRMDKLREKFIEERYSKKLVGSVGKQLPSSLSVPEKKQMLLMRECWVKFQVVYCPLFVWLLYNCLRNNSAWWAYLMFYFGSYVCCAEFVLGVTQLVGTFLDRHSLRQGGILLTMVRTPNLKADRKSQFDSYFFDSCPSAQWLRLLPHRIGLSPAPPPQVALSDDRNCKSQVLTFHWQSRVSRNREAEMIGHIGDNVWSKVLETTVKAGVYTLVSALTMLLTFVHDSAGEFLRVQLGDSASTSLLHDSLCFIAKASIGFVIMLCHEVEIICRQRFYYVLLSCFGIEELVDIVGSNRWLLQWTLRAVFGSLTAVVVNVDLHHRLWLFFAYDFWELWSDTDSVARLWSDLNEILGKEDEVDESWQAFTKDATFNDPSRSEATPCSPICESAGSSKQSPESVLDHVPYEADYRIMIRSVSDCRGDEAVADQIKQVDLAILGKYFPVYVSLPQSVQSPEQRAVRKLTEDETFEARVCRFTKQFNPASAGINMLRTERLQQLPQALPADEKEVTVERVSVDLRRCLSGMLENVQSSMLPHLCVNVHEVVGSAYNIVGKSVAAPLIVDTGASCCITPNRDDFVDGTYKDSEVKIKDLSGCNKVGGKGMIRWSIKDSLGRVQTIEIEGYHVPLASVRLLSPQCIYNSFDDTKGSQDRMKYVIHLGQGKMLDANYNYANLPVLNLVQEHDSFGLWHDCFSFNMELRDNWARSVLEEKNQNLTLAQQECLLWHHRLSHYNLSTVHNLCRQKKAKKVQTEDELIAIRDGPSLPCIHNVPNSVCRNLLCSSCCIAKAKRRKPSIHRSSTAPEKEMVLKEEKLKPGDRIHCDHYLSPVRGRVTAASGHSSTTNGYVGGTIYVDSASGYVFHRPQKSISASDTIRGKLIFEQEAADAGVKIKSYHSDNGVFNSKEFKDHCTKLDQKLTFSGVGAKFQNGVAENAIGFITSMARANMIHATIHHPRHKFINSWPLAMSYAIWCYNKVPKEGTGWSPEELWTGFKAPRSALPRAHVFGCPVYVLDPKLQDGQKIPKWDCKARQGIFVGFSSDHSSTVPLVLNPTTGSFLLSTTSFSTTVLPQCHL
jgi:transposase InsO family protein